MHHFRAKKALIGREWQHDVIISVGDDGTIYSIENAEYLIGLSMNSVLDNVIDLGESSLLPGLIDTHVHGAVGCDVMDASHESLDNMSTFFASKGVVGFVATTVTAPVDKIRSALKQVGVSKKIGMQGAELLGAYLEGPYFTEKNQGAHPTQWFRELNNEELNSWISYSDNSLITVALAPEKEGAIKAIRHLKQAGIKVMLGHSDAGFSQVEAAFSAGADGIVHCFNGMRGLHHRDPGVVGVGLCSASSYVEIIADGHHVHPTAIDVAYRCCGDRLTLITDAMQATGMPNGQYRLGEYQVDMLDGVVRTKQGGLAGSTLTLDQSVTNLSNWLNIPFEKAWLHASLTPAQSLGLDGQLGSLAVGKKASMVAISPTGQILRTWVCGNTVFEANSIDCQEATCI